jgi:Mg-chelatase subunit ChlD
MNAIVQGSIGAIAQQLGKSIAETFINADVIIIVDSSGSMGTPDSRGGRTRLEVANTELADLQGSMPGKIAVINFSSTVQFEPSGRPTDLGGGTNLVAALKFVKVADVPDMKFILISDGEPGDPDEAIRIAKTFTNHIDVIYVGPEDRPHGRDYLMRLAKTTGGKTVTADRAKELKAGVMGLLGAGR